MKTAVAVSDELSDIIGHMETDRLSISPYLKGYIIAIGSKDARRLKWLEDATAVQPIDSPYENYLFVSAEDWLKVKHKRPKPEERKPQLH
jgi:hypothetical protein